MARGARRAAAGLGSVKSLLLFCGVGLPRQSGLGGGPQRAIMATQWHIACVVWRVHARRPAAPGQAAAARGGAASPGRAMLGPARLGGRAEGLGGRGGRAAAGAGGPRRGGRRQCFCWKRLLLCRSGAGARGRWPRGAGRGQVAQSRRGNTGVRARRPRRRSRRGARGAGPPQVQGPRRGGNAAERLREGPARLWGRAGGRRRRRRRAGGRPGGAAAPRARWGRRRLLIVQGQTSGGRQGFEGAGAVRRQIAV